MLISKGRWISIHTNTYIIEIVSQKSAVKERKNSIEHRDWGLVFR